MIGAYLYKEKNTCIYAMNAQFYNGIRYAGITNICGMAYSRIWQNDNITRV